MQEQQRFILNIFQFIQYLLQYELNFHICTRLHSRDIILQYIFYKEKINKQNLLMNNKKESVRDKVSISIKIYWYYNN